VALGARVGTGVGSHCGKRLREATDNCGVGGGGATAGSDCRKRLATAGVGAGAGVGGGVGSAVGFLVGAAAGGVVGWLGRVLEKIRRVLEERIGPGGDKVVQFMACTYRGCIAATYSRQANETQPPGFRLGFSHTSRAREPHSRSRTARVVGGLQSILR
jgi:hypothetical protein